MPQHEIIALAFDPGSRRVGYGVIAGSGSRNRCIAAGCIDIRNDSESESLKEIFAECSRLLLRYKPDIVAVEKLYFAKNQKTALQVAQARGVILLACEQSGARIEEPTPNEIKLALTGYGNADKHAVAKLVGQELTLDLKKNRLIDDATDALASAITAIMKARFRKKTEGTAPRRKG
jgi:crossover junction endodeoxyribonuclease RuvC